MALRGVRDDFLENQNALAAIEAAAKRAEARARRGLCLSFGLVLGLAIFSQPAKAEPVHAIAMHGTPKYEAGFDHFDYVNPNAPKGGEIRLSAVGSTFDSLNPFIIKGIPAQGSSFPFETLLTTSADEAFTEYGLIAQSLEVPQDRSWVIFNINPKARWQDGKPITADDVMFSFDVIRTKGQPQFRFYYQAVDKAEKLGELKVKFTFKPGDNRELPLIMGQLPILPKHYWQGRDFEKTTLEPPLGSGPYRITKFEPGRYVELERVKDYWGANLPVRKGENNFDKIRYDYYRDSVVALEAFKAGEFDWRSENSAKMWATGYEDWDALSSGKAIKRAFPNHRPTGMQGFVYNLRRPLFQDPKVREALAYAFDFEWSNKTLFYGQYTRTNSFFDNSELAADSLPSSAELVILNPLKSEIPPEVFTSIYKAPITDGSGNDRPNLRIAMKMLEEAGWHVEEGRLVKDGQPFDFEILLDQAIWERISLPFVRNLDRLGIKARVRTIDTAQYKRRMDSFDFDVVVGLWPASQSPGNEQRGFWGGAAADEQGGDNLGGIKNPAVDKLIDLLVASPDREALVTRSRALDRVLLWNHYTIPHWHLGVDRIAYWDKFGLPDVIPSQGTSVMTWWVK